MELLELTAGTEILIPAGADMLDIGGPDRRLRLITAAAAAPASRLLPGHAWVHGTEEDGKRRTGLVVLDAIIPLTPPRPPENIRPGTM